MFHINLSVCKSVIDFPPLWIAMLSWVYSFVAQTIFFTFPLAQELRPAEKSIHFHCTHFSQLKCTRFAITGEQCIPKGWKQLKYFCFVPFSPIREGSGEGKRILLLRLWCFSWKRCVLHFPMNHCPWRWRYAGRTKSFSCGFVWFYPLFPCSALTFRGPTLMKQNI